MTARRIARTAGFAGGIGWIAKIGIMAIQGGPDARSIPENVAFFLGLAGVLVAGAAAGIHLARARTRPYRVAAAVAGVLAVVLLVGAGQTLFTALPGNGWFQKEATFGLAGLVVLLTTGIALRPGRERGN